MNFCGIYYKSTQKFARLAQLVERVIYTDDVGGSSPPPRTIAPVVQWIEQETSNF